MVVSFLDTVRYGFFERRAKEPLRGYYTTDSFDCPYLFYFFKKIVLRLLGVPTKKRKQMGEGAEKTIDNRGVA